MSNCQTPVALILFNRPEPTRAVMQRIAAARPAHLLLIADGPRADRPNEAALCEEARRIATAIDWPCKVEINFAETNMGCRNRVASGITWVFKQVEEAIILEDDILVDPSFFPFCDEMLARYRNDPRIAMVSAFNIVEDLVPAGDSYYFSQLTHIWGWATWRRAWQHYDANLTQWPQLKALGKMLDLYPDSRERAYWTTIFDSMHNGTGPDTWDYQWAFTNRIHNALSIVPRVNMMQNIGFGPDATHTISAEAAPPLRASALSFPLTHPQQVAPNKALDTADSKRSHFFQPTLVNRVSNKLQRIFSNK